MSAELAPKIRSRALRRSAPILTTVGRLRIFKKYATVGGGNSNSGDTQPPYYSRTHTSLVHKRAPSKCLPGFCHKKDVGCVSDSEPAASAHVQARCGLCLPDSPASMPGYCSRRASRPSPSLISTARSDRTTCGRSRETRHKRGEQQRQTKTLHLRGTKTGPLAYLPNLDRPIEPRFCPRQLSGLVTAFPAIQERPSARASEGCRYCLYLAAVRVRVRRRWVER